MTSEGRSHARFLRAHKTGNLTIIRAAVAELSHVDLGDALTVCVAIREAEPERFERATLRWLARFCVEHRGASPSRAGSSVGSSPTATCPGSIVIVVLLGHWTPQAETALDLSRVLESTDCRQN